MDREFPHPELIEYLGFWRRRRQQKPEEGGGEGNSNRNGRNLLAILEYLGFWGGRRQSEPEERGGEGNSNRNNRNPPTIFRVPGNIRQDEPKAYEPTVVSIGPLHRSSGSSSNSLAAMEETKWRCFHLLLDRRDPSPESGLYNECMDAMTTLQASARECYPAHSLDNTSHSRFAEILLLDGCFILYHLLKEYEDRRSSSSSENEDGISCCEWMLEVGASCNGWIRRDDVNRNTGNVELTGIAIDNGNPEEEVGHHNQSSLENDNDRGNSLATFHLPKSNWRENSLVKYDLLKIENQIPFYVIETLFDLLRTPQDEDLVDIALNFFEVLHPKRAKPLFDISSHQIDHLLQLFHMSIIPEFLPCISNLKDRTPTAMLLDWFPSATELQEWGVKFRKGKNEAGNFLNVNFNKGVMEMGPIHIFNYSSSVFRNIIAFEACSAVPPYITIYAFFMGRIMRKVEDVRLLRSQGILVNRRGSDEEAALFFDKLCKEIHYPDRSDYFRDIFIGVKKYYESRPQGWKAIWHWWKAILVGISFVALINTYLLPVEQGFFAAFSYLRPTGSSN